MAWLPQKKLGKPERAILNWACRATENFLCDSANPVPLSPPAYFAYPSVHVFFAIYAPTRFDDTVFVRWSFRDRTSAWQDSDRIPIRITGGRESGFRGVATKENYVAGAWRVVVETRDRREIARLRGGG